ncbi:hypothetical protein AVEN_156233-1, partial [Araneus ventricosus]
LKNISSGRSGLVVRSKIRDRKVQDSTPLKICRVWLLLHAKTYAVAKRPLAGVAQKIPTLARPTQKGCKAGRGPVGRPPPVCGGWDLLGTIKKMIRALPEQGQ